MKKNILGIAVMIPMMGLAVAGCNFPGFNASASCNANGTNCSGNYSQNTPSSRLRTTQQATAPPVQVTTTAPPVSVTTTAPAENSTVTVTATPSVTPSVTVSLGSCQTNLTQGDFQLLATSENYRDWFTTQCLGFAGGTPEAISMEVWLTKWALQALQQGTFRTRTGEQGWVNGQLAPEYHTVQSS